MSVFRLSVTLLEPFLFQLAPNVLDYYSMTLLREVKSTTNNLACSYAAKIQFAFLS